MTTAAAAQTDEAAQAAAKAEESAKAKQPTPDELWAQAQKDRSTQADDTSGHDDGGDGGEQENPLAGLPEPTRKLFEQIQAKTAEQDAALKEVGQKLAKAHGTIGNLTKQLGDSMLEIRQLKPTVDAVAATKQAEAEAEKAKKEARRKELKETMAEMPEIVEYMDLVVADAKPAAELAKAAPKAEESPEYIRARLTAERELSDRHPKWIETIRGAEYKTWLSTQPDDIKALGASEVVDDADKLLTTFKKHKEDAAKIAQVEAERQARLRRNESIEGKGSASKDGDASPDALWQKAKRDREKARAQT